MGPIKSHESLNSKEPCLAVVREGDVTTEEQSERCHTAGFEDGGRDPCAKECGQPHRACKGKGMDFPLYPPGRNTAQPAPWF